MPFQSQAQRRWMHATHPEMAERWEKHTPDDAPLPERAGDSKKKKTHDTKKTKRAAEGWDFSYPVFGNPLVGPTPADLRLVQAMQGMQGMQAGPPPRQGPPATPPGPGTKPSPVAPAQPAADGGPPPNAMPTAQRLPLPPPADPAAAMAKLSSAWYAKVGGLAQGGVNAVNRPASPPRTVQALRPGARALMSMRRGYLPGLGGKNPLAWRMPDPLGRTGLRQFNRMLAPGAGPGFEEKRASKSSWLFPLLAGGLGLTLGAGGLLGAANAPRGHRSVGAARGASRAQEMLGFAVPLAGLGGLYGADLGRRFGPDSGMGPAGAALGAGLGGLAGGALGWNTFDWWASEPPWGRERRQEHVRRADRDRDGVAREKTPEETRVAPAQPGSRDSRESQPPKAAFFRGGPVASRRDYSLVSLPSRPDEPGSVLGLAADPTRAVLSPMDPGLWSRVKEFLTLRPEYRRVLNQVRDRTRGRPNVTFSQFGITNDPSSFYESDDFLGGELALREARGDTDNDGVAREKTPEETRVAPAQPGSRDSRESQPPKAAAHRKASNPMLAGTAAGTAAGGGLGGLAPALTTGPAGLALQLQGTFNQADAQALAPSMAAGMATGGGLANLGAALPRAPLAPVLDMPGAAAGTGMPDRHPGLWGRLKGWALNHPMQAGLSAAGLGLGAYGLSRMLRRRPREEDEGRQAKTAAEIKTLDNGGGAGGVSAPSGKGLLPLKGQGPTLGRASRQRIGPYGPYVERYAPGRSSFVTPSAPVPPRVRASNQAASKQMQQSRLQRIQGWRDSDNASLRQAYQQLVASGQIPGAGAPAAAPPTPAAPRPQPTRSRAPVVGAMPGTPGHGLPFAQPRSPSAPARKVTQLGRGIPAERPASPSAPARKVTPPSAPARRAPRPMGPPWNGIGAAPYRAHVPMPGAPGHGLPFAQSAPAAPEVARPPGAVPPAYWRATLPGWALPALGVMPAVAPAQPMTLPDDPFARPTLPRVPDDPFAKASTFRPGWVPPRATTRPGAAAHRSGRSARRRQTIQPKPEDRVPEVRGQSGPSSGMVLALEEGINWNELDNEGAAPDAIEGDVRATLAHLYPETYPAYWAARQKVLDALKADGAMARAFRSMPVGNGLVTEDQAEQAWARIGPHLEAITARALAPYVMDEPTGDVNVALERLRASRKDDLDGDGVPRDGLWGRAVKPPVATPELGWPGAVGPGSAGPRVYRTAPGRDVANQPLDAAAVRFRDTQQVDPRDPLVTKRP